MTGGVFAQVELRLTINFEAAAFDGVEPFRASKRIQIRARDLARIEMHLYRFLAVDPSGIGRDDCRMLGEARFARPEAWCCVGDAFAEAIFDPQVPPQQAEIARHILSELMENGGDLFVQRQSIVAVG